MDIIKLTKLPEGQTLEFKRDTSSLDSILKAVIAFANSAGGIILIGVDDDGSIVGLSEPAKAQEQVTNADEVPKFIRRNTKMAGKFVGMQRKDITEYPMEGIREALVNALVHPTMKFLVHVFLLPFMMIDLRSKTLALCCLA